MKKRSSNKFGMFFYQHFYWYIVDIVTDSITTNPYIRKLKKKIDNANSYTFLDYYPILNSVGFLPHFVGRLQA